MKCVFCDAEIDAANDYRKVTGWERIRRDAGGTNAIRLPERSSGEVACKACIDRDVPSILDRQESLI